MQRLNQLHPSPDTHPQLPHSGSGRASYPTLMGSPASVFLPHTSCRTTHDQHRASTQVPCPPPYPRGLPPTVNLIDHTHGPLTHPSSPWSQPLMTWPVPREKTKGWFWGRLLSNSVPSSSFPCGTMGRPVKRRVHSEIPPHPAALSSLAPHFPIGSHSPRRGQSLGWAAHRTLTACWCQPGDQAVNSRGELWKLCKRERGLAQGHPPCRLRDLASKSSQVPRSPTHAK